MKKRHPRAGARPGTLLLSRDARATQVRVTRLRGAGAETRVYDSPGDIPRESDPNALVWIDVAGLGSAEKLVAIAKRFQISPLAMEDLVNETQRPKVELFEHQQLVIANGLAVDGSGKPILQHLGLIFDKNHVITFHDDGADLLTPIRQRLENPNARLHRNGADYLVYAIVDALVDGYYPALEELGERLEQLERRALENPHSDLIGQVHTLKNHLLLLRRSVWPQRDMVQSLLLSESPFIKEGSRQFLRDTLDHCAHLADVVDMYRESTSGLANTYMAAVAHRSNEIMKLMTLMTSLFVPPTFIAGVYGMNFAGMQELELPGAYPTILVVMAVMIVGMLLYFRRRGWLGYVPIADPAAAESDSHVESHSFELADDTHEASPRAAA